MKFQTRPLLNAALAGFLASGAGSALAADTSVPVTASVSAVCTVGTTQATIAIPAIDPSAVSSDPTQSGDIVYRCTNGTTPTVAVNSGGTTLTSSGAGAPTMAYTFALGTAEPGKGFGGADTSKVVGTATITVAVAEAAEAGNYTDTVVVSITP